MDGRREAHMDVLVAVFWRRTHQIAAPNPSRLGAAWNQSESLPVIPSTQFDNGIDERPGMLPIHIRGNTMPQVKDMPGAGTIAGQEVCHFLPDTLCPRIQHG